MKNEGYNGWKNYETWNVALWIDNDQGSYSMRCEMAEDAWEESERIPHGSSTYITREDRAKTLLADRLQNWVEEMRPEMEPSMFSDLLGAALSEVDWYEMAENFLEDVEKESEQSEETEETL